MNILFLARENPFPADTGVKMRAWMVLKSLAKAHRVTLVCFGDDKNGSVPGCEAVHVIEPPAKKSGHPYGKMLLGLFSSLPFAVEGRISGDYDRKVKGLLDGNKFDLIVCDSLYLAPYVPAGATKTLLDEHNIESVIIRRYAQLERNIFKKVYALYELGRMKRFESQIWNRFDLMMVCSQVDKQQAEQRSRANKIHVVPNGVLLPAELNNREEPGTLLYSGLIGWRPNEDAVFYFAKEIYPLIKRAIPQTRWLIVGKGPTPAVKSLEEEGSITVTGAVEKIEPYIEKSAVVVVPLRIASGTRLKILEALAMGKAVVSTSVGAEGLDVTYGKNILIADEPEDFANAVIGLLKDVHKRKELGANGRKLVEEKYSYEIIGKKIDEVIKLI